MRANVKPLVHWAIYKGYKIRYTDRTAAQVKGILTTPEGEQDFRFDPAALTINLPDRQITINQYGWELSQDAETAANHDTADKPDNPEDQR